MPPLAVQSAARTPLAATLVGTFVGTRGPGGAISWGMGAALGAQLARPNRRVVAIVGDGSSMMTVQALWTAAAFRIPVVYFVCNNRSYRILKLNMNVYQTEIRDEPEPSSSYPAMDFPLRLKIAAIARAIGVHGETISDPEELRPAIGRAIGSV